MPTLSSAPCLDTPASNRGRFRALSSRPGRAPQDLQLIGALNQEWDRMLGSPEVDARVRRWSDQHVALRGLHTLGELWAAGREHRRKEASDELLHALVACAQDGEQLAGRVVVQLFLGRAVRLIRSQVPATGAESMEVEAQVVAALWQAVASYPLANRPQRVAANLSMEMLRFTQQRWAGVSIST